MNSENQKTILLVDDEVIVAMNDVMKLKEYGYKVIHVLNGKKAIEAVNDNKTPVDLILMDINLGEKLDGTEIAKTILKDHDIPLLFHSSHTEREIVDRTENITSYGYVVKDGITVLDASIKMAFRLHEAYLSLKTQKTEMDTTKKEFITLEKRYRRLFEAAKDGILILNADNGMIVDVNPFLVNMLGYSKEEFLEKKIWDISAFKNIDYAKQMYKELQAKDYVTYDDIPLETKDGKQIHVEFVSNVYLVDTDRVIQCNIRDITDRKKNQQTLTDDRDNKEALLRELQHRTKNSFAMITSLIHLSSNGTHSDEIKNTLEELTLRVKSISDLYSLLHETNSYFDVQLKAYSNKVIESMLNFSNSFVINKHIEEITVPTKTAGIVGMILVELLSNAIKYAFPETHAGTINVELKTVNSQIVLKVEDNGIGLGSDFDISKIKTLGLHLVDLMVRQLNGKIKFITEKGTNIIIEFPLSEIKET